METNQILIVGELIDHSISPMTAQLMKIGKKISLALNKTLDLVFLGDESLTGEESGFQYGAHTVYKCTDSLLGGGFMADAGVQALEQIAEHLKPAVILFGHNDMGLELAPRLAFRIGTGVILDCIDLEVDKTSGDLEFIKPVFGGKAHAHFCITSKQSHLATIREGAFDLLPCELSDQTAADSTRVIQLPLKIDPKRIKTNRLKKEIDESIALALKLSSSKVVVCGGRGLKTSDGIDLIKETAGLLDGAIAGSRPVIDNGWLSNTLQVGLTGKKVSPQMYFAVGVSGALQHMVGCLKSKTIVAINSDDTAQIYKFAHIGVVGKYQEVLRGFNDEVRRIIK